MNNYLVQVQEIYRVNTEKEAQDLISSAKEESGYELIKYNCEHKEKKSKGDVIDDWYKVSLVKRFNDEKEPVFKYRVSYEVE